MTRLSGYIEKEFGMYYQVRIEEIDGPDHLPCYRRGSCVDLMKSIVERNFVRLDRVQLHDLRELALSLKQIEWCEEINNRLCQIN